MLLLEHKQSCNGCYIGLFDGSWGLYFPRNYKHPYDELHGAATATHTFVPFGEREDAEFAFKIEEMEVRQWQYWLS